MDGDLDTLLADAAPRPRTPVDVDAVLARGRTRTRRRAVGVTAGAVTAVLVLGGVVAAVTGDAGPTIEPASPRVDEVELVPGRAVAVGDGDEVTSIDLAAATGLAGEIITTVDGLQQDDLVVLGQGATIGVLAGDELRIERDREVVARALLSEQLGEPDRDDTTPGVDVGGGPRSMTFDGRGTLWLYVGPLEDPRVVGLSTDGAVRVLRPVAAVDEALVQLGAGIESEVQGGRWRSAQLAIGGASLGDESVPVSLHIGDYSAARSPRPSPPDRYVSVLAALSSDAGSPRPGGASMSELGLFGTASTWNADRDSVDGGALIGWTSSGRIDGGDVIVARGLDLAMELELGGTAVRRPDGGDLPAYLQAPGTGLVTGPGGSLTGVWTADLDTYVGRRVLVLAPELGPGGSDLAIRLPERLWGGTDGTAGGVRPLVAPDGSIGVTVERADGVREVRLLVRGTTG